MLPESKWFPWSYSQCTIMCPPPTPFSCLFLLFRPELCLLSAHQCISFWTKTSQKTQRLFSLFGLDFFFLFYYFRLGVRENATLRCWKPFVEAIKCDRFSEGVNHRLCFEFELNFFFIFFFLLLKALSQMIQNTENICFHIHKTMLINVCEVPVMHIKHLKERKLFALLKDHTTINETYIQQWRQRSCASPSPSRGTSVICSGQRTSFCV